MKKFTSLTSDYTPLVRNDIDTDLIIPAQFLTRTTNTGYGDTLFYRLRETEKDFPLNNPALKDSEILLTGHNFGCGSSREHAVWALRDYGFRVIIAQSFADIFSGNAAKSGLLLITLSNSEIATIASNPLPLTVSLEEQTVKQGDSTYQFSYDPFRKHCLLAGLDDLDYLRSQKESIEAYFAKRETTTFFSLEKL